MFLKFWFMACIGVWGGRAVEGWQTGIRVTGDTSSMVSNFHNQFLLTFPPPVVSVSALRVRRSTFVVYLNK